jgi:DNA repair protein RecO (recombination protein O)
VLPDLAQVTLTLQPVADDGRYLLVPESGVVPTRDDAGIAGIALRGLQTALDDGSPAALQSACVPCLTALRNGLRALLHYHLGTATLRTRQVMQSVQRLTDHSTGPAR